MSTIKRLVVGDIHGHWDNFKSIYDRENPDEVIVLGDYWDNFNGTDTEIITCFVQMCDLMDEHNKTKRGQFTMLIGNHDYHYLYWFEKYSGYRTSYASVAYTKLKERLDNKKLMYVAVDHVNKTIYSHAGVTNHWLSEWKLNDVDLTCINDANPIAFKFTYKGGGDMWGNTIYASPIWCRPQSLGYDPYKDKDGEVWTQIVGHTNMKHPEASPDANNPYIYVIDTMPHHYIIETLDFTSEELIERKIVENTELC